ncbi:MAG TPA: endonuclease III [Candidatus Edwardsbacteria bacterium]|nr:endonuclease III [Candidatus Edwardsbacteria bacterium]
MSILSVRAIDVVAATLQRAYGRPEPVKAGSLLDVLIETVLSQNTSDRNSHAAFLSLRRRFNGWDAVLAAPARSVAAAIRAGGLANIKAARIGELLREFRRRSGRPSLDFIKRMEPEAAYQYLLSLKGVGPKTAACTLLFGLGVPVFPVDTHIFRIARRLGWARPRDDRASFQERIRHIVPDPLVYPLHINLIAHGRAVCHPAAPDCQRCCIHNHCQWYQRRSHR